MSAAAISIARHKLGNTGFVRFLPTQHAIGNETSSDRGPVADAPPPRRRSYTRVLAVAAIIAILAVAAYRASRAWPATPVESESESAATPRTVTITRPVPAETASVTLPATVHAWQVTTLYARVSGYLAAWHRDLGESVKAGELLAEIDTPELDQELMQARALAREAIAFVSQARAEREEAQADLKVAESQLLRVQAETDLARSQLTRRERLLASRSASQEEYETSQRQFEARSADLAAADSDVSRRRAVLATRTAIIEVREATANSREANVERLVELVRFKRIVAPFNGVVTRRNAEVGMLVTVGAEPLYMVEDTQQVRIQVNVPQTYALQVRPGVAARVSIPESSLPVVATEITRIAESIDAGSRTMVAEIELENPAHQFQPGSYAQIGLTTPQNSASWTIPTNTLSMRVSGPHVAVVDAQDQVELRAVRLGRDLGTRVVVVEGIAGNERLVVNPGDDLVDGMPIRIGGTGPAQELVSR